MTWDWVQLLILSNTNEISRCTKRERFLKISVTISFATPLRCTRFVDSL